MSASDLPVACTPTPADLAARRGGLLPGTRPDDLQTFGRIAS